MFTQKKVESDADISSSLCLFSLKRKWWSSRSFDNTYPDVEGISRTHKDSFNHPSTIYYQIQGTPRTAHQSITRPTQKDKQPFNLPFIPMGHRSIGMDRENPHRHRENLHTETPHRKCSVLSQAVVGTNCELKAFNHFR